MNISVSFKKNFFSSNTILIHNEFITLQQKKMLICIQVLPFLITAIVCLGFENCGTYLKVEVLTIVVSLEWGVRNYTLQFKLCHGFLLAMGKLGNSTVSISLVEEILKLLKSLFIREMDMKCFDYKTSSNKYKIRYCII